MFLIKHVFFYMIFGGQIKVHAQIHRGEFSITSIICITREACHGSLESCARIRPAAINESNETLRCFVCFFGVHIFILFAHQNGFVSNFQWYFDIKLSKNDFKSFLCMYIEDIYKK